MNEVPVYVFTGFIESGKTCFIKEMLHDKTFNEKEKNLLIVLEEGIEEYDQNELFDQCHTVVEFVTKEADFTTELLNDLNAKHKPERVLIEYNGMWSLENFLELDAPIGWVLAQIVTTVNAITFEMFINNMRSFMREQLLYSDLIVFNRCEEPIKKSFLRNNAKSINQKAQIIYESKDGIITNLAQEELPYDMNQKEVKIEDIDFGIWYMDALDHPQVYKDKIIAVKGMAMKVENHDQTFVIARNAMVCCADDIAPIGFLCYFPQAQDLAPNEWVEISARSDVLFNEEYGEEMLVLEVLKLKAVVPLEEEFVYFS